MTFRKLSISFRWSDYPHSLLLILEWPFVYVLGYFIHIGFICIDFGNFYTKIEFVVNDLGVSRLTAANYLNKLVEDTMLRKEKLGTGNYYINEKLFDLLTNR